MLSDWSYLSLPGIITVTAVAVLLLLASFVTHSPCCTISTFYDHWCMKGIMYCGSILDFLVIKSLLDDISVHISGLNYS